jgi:hypothetical protein
MGVKGRHGGVGSVATRIGTIGTVVAEPAIMMFRSGTARDSSVTLGCCRAPHGAAAFGTGGLAVEDWFIFGGLGGRAPIAFVLLQTMRSREVLRSPQPSTKRR